MVALTLADRPLAHGPEHAPLGGRRSREQKVAVRLAHGISQRVRRGRRVRNAEHAHLSHTVTDSITHSLIHIGLQTTALIQATLSARTSGGSSAFSRAMSASSSARRSVAAADAAPSPSPSPSPSPPPPASARGGPRTVTVAACRMACTPLSVRPAATGPPSWPVASLSAACTTSKIDGGPGTPGCACHPQ